MVSDDVELRCGCTLPVFADPCRDLESVAYMPTAEGWVGYQKVVALRDIGCSTVVVRRDLVPDEALTGATIACVLIDGTISRLPGTVAEIEVDTSFYKRRIKAIVSEGLYMIIVDNIPGASGKTDHRN